MTIYVYKDNSPGLICFTWEAPSYERTLVQVIEAEETNEPIIPNRRKTIEIGEVFFANGFDKNLKRIK